MRAIPSRRALFFGGASSPLLGATWARDAQGRAYNTPTLGAELVTDGGFENWASATNLTSWTESLAGSTTINQETTVVNGGSSAVRFDQDPSNSQSFISQAGLATVGRWYQASVYIKSNLSGKNANIGTTNNPWTLSASVGITTTYAQYVVSGRATGAALLLSRGATAASSSIYFDDMSFRQISAPTLHAYTLGAANNLAAIARINALTIGTQAGAFALVDNPLNPQNGIYAYHDGTGVVLDKLVAGTWSNVNARVTVAFSADADLEIRPLGSNQFDLYYGGAKHGATATISDASIVSSLYYGLFSTYSGNLFSAFTLDNRVIPFGF